MATETIARSGHEPKATLRLTRLERAWVIYREHAQEIIRSYHKGLWMVPSQTNETSAYEVRLGRGGKMVCECEAYAFSKDAKCKHGIAVQMAAKDSEICSVCGSRFPYNDMEPMAGEHFYGMVCRECGA